MLRRQSQCADVHVSLLVSKVDSLHDAPSLDCRLNSSCGCSVRVCQALLCAMCVLLAGIVDALLGKSGRCGASQGIVTHMHSVWHAQTQLA
jgi:hypothetical protein